MAASTPSELSSGLDEISLVETDEDQQNNILSPCSIMPESAEQTYFDDDGDLTLLIGGNFCVTGSDGEDQVAAEYIVCSRTMARASSVWKRLLYGGFAESWRSALGKNNKPWVVSFPEDNPRAFKLVLKIAHGRFDQVPGINDPITLEDLYQLTVLTDKYDLTKLLRPWGTGWIETVVAEHSRLEKQLGESVVMDSERLLWIAWELGDVTLFDNITKELVLSSMAGIPARPLFLDVLEPPGSMDTITDTRLNVIECILAPFKSTLDALIRSEDPGVAHLCDFKRRSDRKSCQRSFLGYFIQELHKQRLWPIPEPHQIALCIMQLAAKLNALEFEDHYHDDCAAVPNSGGEVDDIIRAIPSTITVPQKRHLEARARQSGIGP